MNLYAVGAKYFCKKGVRKHFFFFIYLNRTSLLGKLAVENQEMLRAHGHFDIEQELLEKKKELFSWDSLCVCIYCEP